MKVEFSAVSVKVHIVPLELEGAKLPLHKVAV